MPAVDPAAGCVGGTQLGSHASGTKGGCDRVMVPEGRRGSARQEPARPWRNRAYAKPPPARLAPGVRARVRASTCARSRRRAPSWSSTWTRAASAGADPLPLPAADRPVHRRALAGAARARPPARPRPSSWAAGAAAYLRVNGLRGRRGRAGAAGDARAPLRGRDRLHLPRGALRARLRRGRAHALRGDASPRPCWCPCTGWCWRAWTAWSWATASSSCAARPPTPRTRRSGANADGGASPARLLMLTRDVAPDDPLPSEEARAALPRAAHRPAAVEAGRRWRWRAVAWRRSGRRALAAVRARVHRRGARRALDPGATARRPSCWSSWRPSTRATAGGPVAWALVRFEMGCGRRAARPRRCPTTCWACARSIDDGPLGPGAAGGRAVRRGRRAQARPAAGRAGPGARAVRDGRRRRRRLPGRGGLGLAAHARRRGGAPPARAAARRAVRLPRRPTCAVADELLLDQPEPSRSARPTCATGPPPRSAPPGPRRRAGDEPALSPARP